MQAFQFINAQTIATASELTRDGKGRLKSGGTDLLGQLKEGLETPERVVNLRSVPGLDRIERDGDQWKIGALVRIADLARHPELGQTFPGLCEAAGEVGSPQIRNLGTVGGNLAQHSRCWYYRHRDIRCLKNGGSRCYAQDGENKYHCLFTRSGCISPITSNLSVALAALGATVTVQRERGPVNWTVHELYAEAWERARAHNSLENGDVITSVSVPIVSGQRSHYRQISEKQAFDWALVSCAVAAQVEGKRLSGARVALGAVAPGPLLRDEVNGMLEGRELTEALAADVAEILLEDAEPREHNAYKVPMAKALVRRSLLALIA